MGDLLSDQDSNPPISTGGGDDGTTTLLGSGRMGKDDLKIIVVGDLDEASSFLGLARAEADGQTGGLLDVARTETRRAERSLVAAGYADGHPSAVRVVNRLSDLLFVLARNADGEKTLSKG